MVIAYRVRNTTKKYCGEWLFKDVNDFIRDTGGALFASKKKGQYPWSHWVWYDEYIKADKNIVTNQIHTFGGAVDFAVDYVLNKKPYCALYNKRNITMEFINLEAQGGMELYYKLFDDSRAWVKYDDIPDSYGRYHCILILYPSAGIARELWEPYQHQYNKTKLITTQSMKNVLDLMKGDEQLALIEKPNWEEGQNWFYGVVPISDACYFDESSEVFVIDDIKMRPDINYGLDKGESYKTSKNKIRAFYNLPGYKCELTGWYKVRGKSTLKVCMESPYAGLSKCEEIDFSPTTHPTELEAKAKQCLETLYDEAREIIRSRDKLEKVIAEFYQVVENKKQKRGDLEKDLEEATDETSKCMFGLMLDRYGDNQCELYDILEKEGVQIDTDLSNIFVMLRHCKNIE